MSRIRIAASVSLASLVLIAGALPSSADLVSTMTVHRGYGNTDGGEFIAYYADFPFTPVSLGEPRGAFETFCVEKDETIHLGDTYYVDFSTTSDENGWGHGDPLDRRTAYLYTQFVTGQLAGYVYDTAGSGHARAASADALQHVIWYIEGEEWKSWHDGDGYLADQFYRDAQAHAGPDIGDVLVANLFGDRHGHCGKQDQLVLTPEPATLVLLAAGVILMPYIRRRS